MMSTIKRHRVQRQSVTARRRDRIPCIQACHPSEVALRIHFTCCVFLRPAREPPNLLDLSRGKQLSIALPPVPTIFPVARSMSSLSDAIPYLQSTCRTRGLIGDSGRDAATKIHFFNSVRSLLTVPVPKLMMMMMMMMMRTRIKPDSQLAKWIPHLQETERNGSLTCKKQITHLPCCSVQRPRSKCESNSPSSVSLHCGLVRSLNSHLFAVFSTGEIRGMVMKTAGSLLSKMELPPGGRIEGRFGSLFGFTAHRFLLYVGRR